MSATIELRYQGKQILVEAAEVVVGRTRECTLRVTHPLVSRAHCRLTVSARGVTLEDLGSANGTFVNDERVEGSVQLRKGDAFTLGRSGPLLEFWQALFQGRDVSDLDEERLQETMTAGDPRALNVEARISVAREALPAVGEEEEAPTRVAGTPRQPQSSAEDSSMAAHEARTHPDVSLDSSAPGGTEPAIETPAPRKRSDSDTEIPVASKFIPPSLFEQIRDSLPGDADAADAPPTEPAKVVPEKPLPPAAPAVPAARGGGSRVAGWLVGIVVGLLVAAAAAVFTELPETLRDAVEPVVVIEPADGGPR